jgi:hypothetical protein
MATIQDGGGRHLGFVLNVISGGTVNFRQFPFQIWEKSVKRFKSYSKILIFKMAADAILNFAKWQNGRFLLHGIYTQIFFYSNRSKTSKVTVKLRNVYFGFDFSTTEHELIK